MPACGERCWGGFVDGLPPLKNYPPGCNAYVLSKWRFGVHVRTDVLRSSRADGCYMVGHVYCAWSSMMQPPNKFIVHVLAVFDAMPPVFSVNSGQVAHYVLGRLVSSIVSV